MCLMSSKVIEFEAPLYGGDLYKFSLTRTLEENNTNCVASW